MIFRSSIYIHPFDYIHTTPHIIQFSMFLVLLSFLIIFFMDQQYYLNGFFDLFQYSICFIHSAYLLCSLFFVDRQLNFLFRPIFLVKCVHSSCLATNVIVPNEFCLIQLKRIVQIHVNLINLILFNTFTALTITSFYAAYILNFQQLFCSHKSFNTQSKRTFQF